MSAMDRLGGRVNRAWILTSYPSGDDLSGLQLRQTPLPEPGENQALVKTLYLSIDPGHRTWMRQEGSYMPPLALGEPMLGGIIGEVIDSRITGLDAGTLVSGMGRWAEYSLFGQRGFTRVESMPGLPLSAALSVLGPTGWTAYFGLLEIGRPRTGETLVVSAAAGAVGSIAGQIGKIKGCRVIGIAGSDEKCRWLVEELGFDAAINYRHQTVEMLLAEHCPNGVDIYFENVGGKLSQAVYARLATRGRVVLCGLVSTYNESQVSEMIDIAPLLMKRIRIESFIVVDYFTRTPEASKELAAWLQSGQLKYRVEMVEGIENAASAFGLLFERGNAHVGKLLVKVAPEAK